MYWKHQILNSFVTGFGVTSGAMSALGIGSAIARYIYLQFYKKKDSILDSPENEDEKECDTHPETESVYESDSHAVQPYQAETTDYFDCKQRYGESYDFEKLATPVTEAYQNAFLQRRTI